MTRSGLRGGEKDKTQRVLKANFAKEQEHPCQHGRRAKRVTHSEEKFSIFMNGQTTMKVSFVIMLVNPIKNV